VKSLKTKIIFILSIAIAGTVVTSMILNRNEDMAPALQNIVQELEHTIEHTINHEHYELTPLPAIPVSTIIPMGQEISPIQMLENIAYNVESIYFLQEPCIFTCGEQILQIKITDNTGNNSIVDATLTILPNKKPPVIEGVTDLVIQRFGTLLLRQNVTAYDVFGNPVQFNVCQAIDTETLGIYSIIYYAYDRWGNRAEVFAYVTITDVDIDWVYARIDQILSETTRSGDNQVEQSRAIYTWMRRNMTYSATAGLSGRYENAYQGLRHRRGNCFVYFYTAEMMLTRLGIPNKRIDRVGSATNHRWHLINPDDMGWHHMDTGPQNLAIAGRFCTFMFTSSQAAEFTDIIYRVVGRHSHYVYDRELHYYIVN